MNYKKILYLTILLMIFILPSGALAGTYWVSNNGTATWSNCLSATPLSGTACCSPTTAFANATGNDLVYFRGGTYIGGSTGDYASPYYYPSHSGNSWNDPLIFKAYTGETVTFSKTTGDPVIGIRSNGANYVTFDGFIIKNDYTGNGDGAHMTLNGGNGTYQIGIRVLNCEFNSRETINNGDLADQLFMRGISGFLIQNCYFHNHRATGGDIENTGAITTYSVKNSTSPAIDAVIEKCTFRDLSAGVNYKLNSSSGTACTGLKLRYNLFYDIDHFDVNINYNSSNGEFYQNLFIDGFIASQNSGNTAPNHKIYNNTFIGGESSGDVTNPNFHNTSSHIISNWEWYNNICYGKAASPTYILTEQAGSDPTYADYNLYYASGTKYWSLAWTSHTLAQWQATPHFYDTHCVTTKPTFTNYTGDETGNYKLAAGSSGINVGRHGENMGCYITGNEQIGAGAALIGPSAPRNLSIIP